MIPIGPTPRRILSRQSSPLRSPETRNVSFRSISFRSALIALFALSAIVSTSGCMQELAQIMYVIKGHEKPPAFAALQEKNVAIVCLSDASAYGPDTLAYTITKQVSAKMARSKDEIKIVSPIEVEEFIDLNGWDESSVDTLGHAVGADYIVVVDISAYSIKDGQTLFKGRSDLTIKVFDVAEDGKIVFEKGPDEFVFPENGRPVMQTTPRQFEAFYLARLTDYISNLFISHDHLESFASDAMME